MASSFQKSLRLQCSSYKNHAVVNILMSWCKNMIDKCKSSAVAKTRGANVKHLRQLLEDVMTYLLSILILA